MFTVAGYVVLIASPTVPALFIVTALVGTAFGMYLASDAVIMTQVLPNLEGSAAKDLGILNLATLIDRKSVESGKSVSVRVDICGRRIIKNKKQKQTKKHKTQ